MTWKPPPEFDKRIREWMATQDWPFATPYTESNKTWITGWECEGPDGYFTLLVGRKSIEEYSSSADRIDEFIEELDRLGVAAKIRKDPTPYALVTLSSEGGIEVEQLQEWPT